MTNRPASNTAPAGPVPQRALRAHRPPRPSDRAAVAAEHLAELSHRLTARDRWLAHQLLEHRVLTSTQIVQLGFGVPRTANLRLAKLYQWRVLDRFQPFAGRGSAPMHYVLDLAGAHILAAAWGLTPADLGYRHDRAIAIGHSLRLAHTVATAGIYTALVAMARHSGPHSPDSGGSPRRVTAWWSESRCAHYFGTHVRPDGYGRWHEAGQQIEFFLEYDFGTEPLAKVADKLADYHRLARATGLVTPVLFWFPTRERENNARAALATALTGLAAQPAQPGALVPVATTRSLPADPSPHTGLSTGAGGARQPGRRPLAAPRHSRRARGRDPAGGYRPPAAGPAHGGLARACPSGRSRRRIVGSGASGRTAEPDGVDAPHGRSQLGGGDPIVAGSGSDASRPG